MFLSTELTQDQPSPIRERFVLFSFSFLYIRKLFSSYLELTSRVSDRRTLTKLRISNHKLMIELGRYNNTPRDNRLCPVCDCNTTEDEIHFLFYCSKYATIRDNFYKKIKPIIQNVSRLPVPDLILELMNSSDYFVIMQLIKFISSCFDSRNKVLSM